jgi:hypothetical protein
MTEQTVTSMRFCAKRGVRALSHRWARTSKPEQNMQTNYRAKNLLSKQARTQRVLGSEGVHMAHELMWFRVSKNKINVMS